MRGRAKVAFATTVVVLWAVPGIALGAAVPSSARPITPVPAVTSVQVHSTWGAPWASTSGAVVPLFTPDACSQVGASNTPVGYVQASDGRSSAVRATCLASGHRAVLHLSFDRLALTGATYHGRIMIGDTSVAVAVQRVAVLWIPVVALLLGLFLALWLLARAPQRALTELKRRLLTARARIGSSAHPGEALVAFRRAAGGADWGRLDVFDDAQTVGEQISRDVAALAWGKRFTLTVDDPQAKALSDRIGALETAIIDLGPLADSLLRLQQRIGLVDASKLLPEWTKTVHDTLLTGRVAEISEIAGQFAAAADAAAIAEWWPAVVQQISMLEDRVDELENHQDQWDDDWWPKIATARGLLNVALGGFDRATTTDGIRKVHANQLERAQEQVDGLASLRVTPRGGVAAARMQLLSSVTVGPPEAYEQEARAVVRTERRASIFSVVALALLFVIGGLKALYVGKTFGTVWDDVAALAWGTAAGALVTPLATAIEGLSPIRSRITHG